MGTLYRGAFNEKGNGRHKRTKGACTAAALFLPPVIRTAIRSTVTIHPMQISEEDLHPDTIAILNDISVGKDTSYNFSNRDGHQLSTRFTSPENRDGNLHAQLSLHVDETLAFSGQVEVATYFARGRVATGHCVIGIVETLFDELFQAAQIGRQEIKFHMGLAGLSGEVSGSETVLQTLKCFYKLLRHDGEPGLDATLYYGFYPDLGSSISTATITGLSNNQLSVGTLFRRRQTYLNEVLP